MPIEFISMSIPEVILIKPDIFKDSRGFFIETFHQRKYTKGGINKSFVQDNFSHSTRNILRGLHYQLRFPQAKLIYAVKGEIFDVVVDIRYGSPTFGKCISIILSVENGYQLYVPEGFAHGFCVLSETADVLYKCTDFYAPGDEFGILWSDPNLGIHWPIEVPILSDKDSKNPKLGEVPKNLLPAYKI